ncbi:D-2-hydroxyacid dehydrogenase family protein [Olivibacter ginsenosidimutans]|uniref:D-2-hydroxyacid dehydrogenase family protein n=1 Tax=Olivibacter ginsenosidimutans TaxID=1176537 RepID=A0ABP9CAI1_9SPHI
MKITILDDYQNVIKELKCFDLLKEQLVQIRHHTEKNPEKLAEQLQDTDILVLTRERTKIDDRLLSLLPNLKLISQTGKISNHLNISDCTKHKVLVSEGIGSPIAPAELTWALLMNTVRQLPQAIEAMKAGKWQINIGNTVYEKTIGIWGYGKIGQLIAQYAKVFGANVIIWGSEKSRAKALADGFSTTNSKEVFFKTADIITIHLRLTKDTLGIIRETDLMRMKENSILINTARAELIEKGALVHCLKKGRPSFAGLDVYEEEPIYNRDNELLKMPQVICTPHLGYVERNSYERYFGKAFENALNYINGHPTNIVNKEIL